MRQLVIKATGVALAAVVTTGVFASPASAGTGPLGLPKITRTTPKPVVAAKTVTATGTIRSAANEEVGIKCRLEVPKKGGGWTKVADSGFFFKVADRQAQARVSVSRDKVRGKKVRLSCESKRSLWYFTNVTASQPVQA